MTTHLLRRTTVVLASLALAAGLAPGSAIALDSVEGGASSDRVGDVRVAPDQTVSPADYDSIDLERFDYRVVPGRRVTFKLRVVNASRPAKLRVWYGVVAQAGADTVYLAARKGGVVVLTDKTRVCRGGTSEVDLGREFVRISAPVRCLSGSDTYRFRPLTLLEKRAGRDVADDTGRRTGRISIR